MCFYAFLLTVNAHGSYTIQENADFPFLNNNINCRYSLLQKNITFNGTFQQYLLRYWSYSK
jgi:hypothetical protein